MLAPNPNSLILPNPESLTKAPLAPKKVAPKPPAAASPLASSLTANPDAQVTAMYQPLINQMTGQAQQMQAGGDQAIQQYAASLANAMGGINYAQPYNAAIGDQAAINSALAQFAQGAGGSTASALQADLQAGKVDPSAVTAAVNAVNAGASGTAGLAGGLGSAELGQLVADRAAGQEYGLQIPQIAKLGALQDMGKLNTSIEANLQNNVDSLEADIPKEELAAQQAAATIANDQAKLGIEQQNANTASARAASYAQSAGSLTAYRQAVIQLKQQGQITDAQYKQAMTALKAQAQASTNAYRQGELSNARARIAASAGKLEARVVNGNTVLFDPTTGSFFDPGTRQPINPNSLAARPRALTSTETRDISQAASAARNGYLALGNTGNARALPKMASITDITKAATQAGMTVAQFEKDPKAQAQEGFSVVQLKDVGKDDPQINRLYMELIDELGISRQQAFSAVGRTFPGWAKRNQKSFFPKGNASAPTGASYQSLAVAAAQRYGIPPQVFLRQIEQESGFNPNAKSGAGALGIAQFMPSTAAAMGVNPMDPASALNGAARLDAQNLKKYGSLASMLSAYNSGNPTAYKDPNFAGGQTYNYVKSILGFV